MNTLEQFEVNFSVITKQAILWGDMDAFQHINNTVYFRYFENVRIEFFEKTGINALMNETQLGPILGSTQCKYLAPLTFPDTISIGTKVTEVREKRFTMVYEVFSEKLNQIVASGSGEIVYFDYASNKTTPIPDTILNNMAKVSQ